MLARFKRPHPARRPNERLLRCVRKVAQCEANTCKSRQSGRIEGGSLRIQAGRGGEKGGGNGFEEAVLGHGNALNIRPASLHDFTPQYLVVEEPLGAVRDEREREEVTWRERRAHLAHELPRQGQERIRHRKSVQWKQRRLNVGTGPSKRHTTCRRSGSTMELGDHGLDRFLPFTSLSALTSWRLRLVSVH